MWLAKGPGRKARRAATSLSCRIRAPQRRPNRIPDVVKQSHAGTFGHASSSYSLHQFIRFSAHPTTTRPLTISSTPTRTPPFRNPPNRNRHPKSNSGNRTSSSLDPTPFQRRHRHAEKDIFGRRCGRGGCHESYGAMKGQFAFGGERFCLGRFLGGEHFKLL